MRRLLFVTANLRPSRRLPAAEKLYGPTLKEMRQLLAAKFDLPPAVAQAFIIEVFRYIHGEVYSNGQTFSIPGFGTFHRIKKPSRPTVAEDVPSLTYTIGLIRSGRLKFEEDPDPEDAGLSGSAPRRVRQFTDSPPNHQSNETPLEKQSELAQTPSPIGYRRKGKPRGRRRLPRRRPR